MSRQIEPRQIEFLPLEKLRPDDKNPKAHAEEVIDASIGRFGFVEPVVLDGRTGFIISGHGRVKTLRKMEESGESLPEGVKTDAEGTWLIPTVTGWASRTDSEAAAALIALNRTTELGGWVDEALLDLLDDLSEMEKGFDGIGFGKKDLEDLQGLVGTLDDEALDELAEEWDGTGVGDKPTVIKIIDPDLKEWWTVHRAGFESDDSAFVELTQALREEQ